MGTDPARVLLVLRHAKAVTGRPGAPDADRPLTGRGERSAVSAGRWLSGAGLAPDLVLCSAALRTRQTWDGVLAGLGAAGGAAEVSHPAGLYRADATGLLAMVQQAGDAVGTLLTVGHNPASHQLVLDLTGAAGLAFPTCALAVVRLPGTWADAAPGTGELAALWTPAGG